MIDSDLMELRRTVLPELVEELGQRFPHATALAMRREGEHVNSQADGKVLDVGQGDLHRHIGWYQNVEGVVFTVWSGSGKYEVATHDLSAEGLAAAARGLAEFPVEDLPYDLPSGPQRKADFSDIEVIPVAGVALDDKIVSVQEFERRILAHSREEGDMAVKASYRNIRTQEIFVGPHLDGAQELSHSNLRAFIHVNDGNNSTMVYLREGAAGFEVMEMDDEKIAAEVANGFRLLTPTEKPQGAVNVILDPDYVGVVAHESFGHGREGDTISHRIARARHYDGQEVAAPFVSMVTDPTLSSHGGYAFDHDGIIGERRLLIDKGRQTKYTITDLHSALTAGLEPTGHGRRQSPFHPVFSRQSYTGFLGLQPDDEGYMPLDEMMEKADAIIVGTTGGMEDPHGWTIQCNSLYGLHIRNGKITTDIFAEPRVDDTVTGLLGRIAGMSGAVHVGSGACGKYHKEFVPVGDGGPYLFLRDVRVA